MVNKETLGVLRKDFYRYGVKDISMRLLFKKILISPTLRFIFFFRLGQFYYRHGKHIRLFVLTALIKLNIINNHNSEMPFSSEIGPGLYIGHFSGITINPCAVLGSNINIHKGVTIGQENRGKRKGVPTIGSNVWIGINSVIVGSITIGDNVLIAPNSFINFNVPSNSVVFGNPAQIKPSIDATYGYVNNAC